MEDFDTALLEELQEAQADLVVLAGCLVVISQRIVDAYPNRIYNIHPGTDPVLLRDGATMGSAYMRRRWRAACV